MEIRGGNDDVELIQFFIIRTNSMSGFPAEEKNQGDTVGKSDLFRCVFRCVYWSPMTEIYNFTQAGIMDQEPW